ncbi:collagen alpha-1(I) chain-like [Sciurus carolinensis]|uniref:collagen alpha-1(I) chain-like n=1 Tax=Sciurus carolinensis TaxID=30640 RepID=UPI001FB2631F|nr:collagen alpha-1(I) chain-like [Sciurus carolinensis]
MSPGLHRVSLSATARGTRASQEPGEDRRPSRPGLRVLRPLTVAPSPAESRSSKPTPSPTSGQAAAEDREDRAAAPGWRRARELPIREQQGYYQARWRLIQAQRLRSSFAQIIAAEWECGFKISWGLFPGSPRADPGSPGAEVRRRARGSKESAEKGESGQTDEPALPPAGRAGPGGGRGRGLRDFPPAGHQASAGARFGQRGLEELQSPAPSPDLADSISPETTPQWTSRGGGPTWAPVNPSGDPGDSGVRWRCRARFQSRCGGQVVPVCAPPLPLGVLAQLRAESCRSLGPRWARALLSLGMLMDMQSTCLWLCWQLNWSRKLGQKPGPFKCRQIHRAGAPACGSHAPDSLRERHVSSSLGGLAPPALSRSPEPNSHIWAEAGIPPLQTLAGGSTSLC